MIKLMDKNETYEVMDLWLRTTTHSNPFVEQNFWQTHYDYVKSRYIDEKDTYVYTADNKIVGFTVVGEDNEIGGLFVDPDYQNRGIGTELIHFLMTEYTLLHTYIYAKNRKAFAFSVKLGFIIDGAIRHDKNNEVMYDIIWTQ